MSLDIKITAQLPKINGNFEELKTQLKTQLRQYDLVVSENDVKVANKMATSINKLKLEISKKRKEIIAELTAPLKEFELQAKELESICETSRQGLLSQTKVFKDKQIDKCKKLLDEELIAIYLKYGVEDEFKTVSVDDLAIPSNLTMTGIAKKARTAIDERVMGCKKLQEKIDIRLLQLEAICLKAGLNIPPTRENINHFLMLESDDDYLHKLENLIKNEITRLEDVNKAKKVITNEQKVIHKEIPSVKIKPQKHKYSHYKNAEEFPTVSKKATFVVTATFEVTVDYSMGPSLEKMLLTKFVKGGFKQVPTVVVQEKLRIA